MNWLAQCFNADWRTGLMITGLVLTMAMAIWLMWRIQHDTSDLTFADWFRGSDGRASWKQAAGIAGFVVGSWCLVYITIIGKVPDGYVLLFLVYFAICIGSPVALQVVSWLYSKGAQQAPQQEVRVSAPADANVQVQTGDKTT